ncbi:MAG TPA: alpha/beta hydrolase, partial [Candidatus Binatia bacterium]|nr:alpha/beta hydrolase [Candidatus Binatia bacterium]
MNKLDIEQKEINQTVHIPANGIKLEGALMIPTDAKGVVLFAHGSGSSRPSPSNNFVAEVIRRAGAGTLLFDLLTREEDRLYENRFDIDLLTWRLERATQWLMEQPHSASLS